MFFVLNIYIKTTHLCPINIVCIHVVLGESECMFISQSTKGTGDENVYLPHAALLLDFIKA